MFNKNNFTPPLFLNPCKSAVFWMVLLFLGIGFQSCQDEEDSSLQVENKPSLSSAIKGVTVENGILVFDSFENYWNAVKLFEENEFSREEIESWESNLGFKSFGTKYGKVLDDLEEAESEVEFNRILEANKDFINAETFQPTVSLYHTLPFINELKLLKINGVYNKYTKDAHISSSLSVEDLLNAETRKVSGETSWYEGYDNLELRSGCSNSRYEFRKSGGRATRMGYRVRPENVRETIRTCKDEYTYKNGEWVWVWTCEEETVITGTIISFNIDGAAFKHSWFSWNTFNTGIRLNGNIELKINGTTFRNSWNKSGRRDLRHYASFSSQPNAWYYVDKIYAYCDHNEDRPLIFNCN